MNFPWTADLRTFVEGSMGFGALEGRLMSEGVNRSGQRLCFVGTCAGQFRRDKVFHRSLLVIADHPRDR